MSRVQGLYQLYIDQCGAKPLSYELINGAQVCYEYNYFLLVAILVVKFLSSTVHRKKFRVPDIGKYPRNRLIPPHIPNIGFVEQKQPWVFAAEFYDSMLVKRVSTGGN